QDPQATLDRRLGLDAEAQAKIGIRLIGNDVIIPQASLSKIPKKATLAQSKYTALADSAAPLPTEIRGGVTLPSAEESWANT
ncbi:hypothetical protein M3M33_16330, partial [Loigolactobacillus coryniformis]|uniref:hypothetical protein n=1 Tax=Loigolactobacillus coryniformis TaxID=1610 RepID=UPI00201B28AC